eukprot:CAMPEP_0206290072 /NCGR_PEP_ID=MMETSP0106_2-20121207/2435_1 /ASSEMBLY_ACC=CAM_ASM_000206 /TAXON_ID=81532 /ORGANISM="Acanthoeca-like sp., Strain 10tr" /LENGTH=1592 /DNA_ID=CAMNT_0053720629 /DNA_START=109 /DNA_END=4887 /DNA_ORIENTATION=-
MAHEGYPWFAGQIESGYAFKLLQDKTDGDFLIRKCRSHDLHMLHVADSAAKQKVRSFKIAQSGHGMFYIERGSEFPSIESLVSNAKRHGIMGLTIRHPYTEGKDEEHVKDAAADQQRKIAKGDHVFRQPSGDGGDNSGYINNAEARRLSQLAGGDSPIRSQAAAAVARVRGNGHAASPQQPPPVPTSKRPTDYAEDESQSMTGPPVPDYNSPLRPQPTEDDTYEVVPELARRGTQVGAAAARPQQPQPLAEDDQETYEIVQSHGGLGEDPDSEEEYACVPSLARKPSVPSPRPTEASPPALPPARGIPPRGAVSDEDEQEEYEVVDPMASSEKHTTSPPAAVPPRRFNVASESASENVDDDEADPGAAAIDTPPRLPWSAKDGDPDLQIVEEYGDIDEDASARPPARPPRAGAKGVVSPVLQVQPGYGVVEGGPSPRSTATARQNLDASGASVDVNEKNVAIDSEEPILQVVEEYGAADGERMLPPRTVPREGPMEDAQSSDEDYQVMAPPPSLSVNKEAIQMQAPPLPGGGRTPVIGRKTASYEYNESAADQEGTERKSPQAARKPSPKPSPRTARKPSPKPSPRTARKPSPTPARDASPDDVGEATGERLDRASFASKLNQTLGSVLGAPPAEPAKSLARLPTVARHRVEEVEKENELLKEKLRQAEAALAAAATANATSVSPLGGGIIPTPPILPPPPPPMPPLPSQATRANMGVPTADALAGAKLKKVGSMSSRPAIPGLPNLQSAFAKELAKKTSEKRKAIKAIHGDAIYATADVPLASAMDGAQRHDLATSDVPSPLPGVPENGASNSGAAVPPFTPAVYNTNHEELAELDETYSEMEALKHLLSEDDGGDIDAAEAPRVDVQIDDDSQYSSMQTPSCQTIDTVDSPLDDSSGDDAPVDAIETSQASPDDDDESEYSSMAELGHGHEQASAIVADVEDDTYQSMPSPSAQFDSSPPPRADLPAKSNAKAQDGLPMPDVPLTERSDSASSEAPEYEVCDPPTPVTAAPPALAPRRTVPSPRDENKQQLGGASPLAPRRVVPRPPEAPERPPPLAQPRAVPEPPVEDSGNTCATDIPPPRPPGRSPPQTQLADGLPHRAVPPPPDSQVDTYDTETHKPEAYEDIDRVDTGYPSEAEEGGDDVYDVTDPGPDDDAGEDKYNVTEGGPGEGDDSYYASSPGAAAGVDEDEGDSYYASSPGAAATADDHLDDTYDVTTPSPSQLALDEDVIYDDGETPPPRPSITVKGDDKELGNKSPSPSRRESIASRRTKSMSGRAATIGTQVLRTSKLGVIPPDKNSPKEHTVYLKGNPDVGGTSRIEMYGKGGLKGMPKHTIRVGMITELTVAPMTKAKKKFALDVVETRSRGQNKYILVSTSQDELEAWKSALQKAGAAVDGVEYLYGTVDEARRASVSPSSPGDASSSIVQLKPGEHLSDTLTVDTGRRLKALQKRFVVLTVLDDGAAKILMYESEQRKRELKEFLLAPNVHVRAFMPKGPTKSAQETGLILQEGQTELKLLCASPWQRGHWQRLIDQACGRATPSPRAKSKSPSPRRRTPSISMDRHLGSESTSEGNMQVALDGVAEHEEDVEQ